MPGLETTEEMFDLRMSEGAKPLFEKVKAFIREEVEPITLEFHQLGEGRAERWSWAPGQLDNELLRGDWDVVRADAFTVFRKKPETMWDELAKSQSRLSGKTAACPRTLCTCRRGG